MANSTIVAAAVAGAVSAFLVTRIQKKKSQAPAPTLETTLRAQGALSLPALTEAIGLKGFSARGKVMFALNELVTQGKARVVPAPEGTPQLQKVNFIKYELTA